MNSMMIDELKTFNIYLAHETAQEIAVTDLLDEEKCLAFLNKQMAEIKAPNLAVTASMISKRYAYLVVSSTLYSMVAFNSVLHMPVKACALSKERKLCIQAGMCKWLEVRSIDREQWRESVLHALFSEHITPILNTLQKTSRLPSAILWENIAIRVNSIYKKTLANELDPSKIERLHSDFHFLKNAGGELFNLQDNPLRKYLKIGEEITMNPCRTTCCMYYKLERDDGEVRYCGICPRKDREERKLLH